MSRVTVGGALIDLNNLGSVVCFTVYSRGVWNRADSTPAYDLLLHLAATCLEKGISISYRKRCGDVPSGLPGPVFAQFLAVESLEHVYLGRPELAEEHVRALATCSRTDCKVTIGNLLFLSVVAESAFIEACNADTGPTHLTVSDYRDLPTLTAALCGNSRIKYVNLFPCQRCGTGLEALFRGLGENLGLRTLDLCMTAIVGECWVILCESLKGHPTMETVDLLGTLHPSCTSYDKVARTRALADMLRENTVLESLPLGMFERDEGIYQDEILPSLRRNCNLSKIATINKIKTEVLRRQVLGRSFSCTEGNAVLIWATLSQNADVAFPNEEELALKRNGG